jgi:hypothetical protein
MWAVLLKPFLYLFFYLAVVYWLMRLAWKLIPDGKVKRFLFRRR